MVGLVACSTKTPAEGEHLGSATQAINNGAPVTWPTTWFAVTKGGVVLSDPSGDGSGSGDVVGDAANAPVFVGSDAAHMYFRLRVAGNPVKPPGRFQSVAWGCELDTDGSTKSTYQYLIIANGIASSDIVQLRQNTTPGGDTPADSAETVLLNGVANATGGYTALSTSPVVNGAPAHARGVAANGSNYFIDFALDKNDFPPTFDPSTQAFRVVCGSSSSQTSLTGDTAGTGTTLTALASDPVLCGNSGCSAACFVDGDCTAAQYCGAATCAAKLANGAAIPTVAGHTPPLNGTCSAAVGTSVCTSGVCDTDNKCGYADGDGTCTTGNAGTVCRGGACSTSLKCMPSGGCLVDGDCSSAQFCNTATKACTAKLTNGTAIPTIAGHTPALAGTCSAPVGTAVCIGAVCDTADNKCGLADGDGPCTVGNAGAVCRSGACSAGLTCIAPGACASDGDCTATQFCNTQTKLCAPKLANNTAIPTITGHTPALDGTCSGAVATVVCTSAVCDTADAKCGYADGDGTCTPGNAGTVCRNGSCSTSGACKPAGGCLVDPDCAASEFCNTQTSLCTPKLTNGSPIPSITGHTPAIAGACGPGVGPIVCTSAVCDSVDDECGFADFRGSCNSLNAGNVCRSGTCSSSGVCMPPGGCLSDGDCNSSTQFCDTGAHACASKIANDGAIPNIAGHVPAISGTCSSGVAFIVCTSGVCDSADNKCGFANTHGSCNQSNAATICRSGACSPGGVCIAPGTCLGDTDCASGQFCNTQTQACVPKLANGTVIPTITGHTPALAGTCDPTVGTTVCTSAICDTADNLCGFGDGHGSCNTGNASTVCRSGNCSVAGVCVAAGACASDLDCLPTEFCNNETSLCKPKLSNSTAIPTIAGHTPPVAGTCSPAVALSVCAAGVCDTKDNLCGYADGDGVCSDTNASSVCRNGVCAPAGVCGTPTGCVSDITCPAGQFCNTQSSICTSRLQNGESIPIISGHSPALDGKCTFAVATAVCVAGVCDGDGKCGLADTHGPCSQATATKVCRGGTCLATNVCATPAKPSGCLSDVQCLSSQFCNTANRTCVTKLANGEAIPTVDGHNPPLDGKCNDATGRSACASGVCDAADDKCGFLDDHGVCTPTNGAEVCRNGSCNGQSGQCGKFTPTGPTATNGCQFDWQCPGNGAQFCDNQAKTCKAKLANGQVLPRIAGHDPDFSGGCSDAVARIVCASGVCDPTDQRCGFPDGRGKCTVDNAANVCRSKLCEPSGTCAYVDDGSLEGGGCSTSGSSSSGGPLALLLGLLVVRSRRRSARA
jgi:hypothetical protein